MNEFNSIIFAIKETTVFSSYKSTGEKKIQITVFDLINSYAYIVKPVLSGHSKIDKTKVLKPCGSSMQDESIAECSPWSIPQYF